jgi:hypothetical protein
VRENRLIVVGNVVAKSLPYRSQRKSAIDDTTWYRLGRMKSWPRTSSAAVVRATRRVSGPTPIEPNANQILRA